MTTWYRDGTVTLTNGSKAVTGAGTEWVDFVLPGGIFFTPTGLYEVESVASDGVLQLVKPYTGPTVSGVEYAIAPTQGYIVELSRLVGLQLSDFGALKDAWTNGAFDGWIKALDLAAASGATKVGSTEGTLQVALDARAKTAALAADDGSGAEMVKTRLPYAGASARPVRKKFTDTVSIMDFGAICDGNSHPLSEMFPTLLLAQARFPFATSLTQQIDWAASQATVNALRERGWKRRAGITGSQQGGKALIPSGGAVWGEPVIFPRSGLYDGSAVGLVGEMMSSAVIIGAENFTPNRGMVEWEAVAARTYFQVFENLTFLLPRTVPGVNAIKFGTVNRSTTLSIFQEYMHGLFMHRIAVDASNSVNEHAILFEGYVRNAQFDYIRANFTRGSNPIYNTTLLKFPEDTGTDPQITGESNGVAYSTFKSILGMGEQGGGGCVIRGRLYECTGEQILCGNQTINNGPSLALTKSFNTVLVQVNVEGGNAQTPGSIAIKDSEAVKLSEIGLGSPNPNISSTGISIINSKNTKISRRISDPSSPPFSLWNGKAVRIDATSVGTVLEDFYLNAEVGQEVEILAPASARNRIEWFNPSTGIRGDLGLRPGYVLAMASSNAGQSIPSGAFTLLIFGNKTRDPLNTYNAASGSLTTPVAGRYRITYVAQLFGVVAGKSLDVMVAFNGGANVYMERHALTGAESFRYLKGDIVVDAPANMPLGIGVTHTFGSAATLTNLGGLANITFEFLG